MGAKKGDQDCRASPSSEGIMSPWTNHQFLTGPHRDTPMDTHVLGLLEETGEPDENLANTEKFQTLKLKQQQLALDAKFYLHQLLFSIVLDSLR